MFCTFKFSFKEEFWAFLVLQLFWLLYSKFGGFSPQSSGHPDPNPTSYLTYHPDYMPFPIAPITTGQFEQNLTRGSLSLGIKWPELSHLKIIIEIEQHVLDTYARITTVLSCHRCLINTWVEKWTTFKYRLELWQPDVSE